MLNGHPPLLDDRRPEAWLQSGSAPARRSRSVWLLPALVASAGVIVAISAAAGFALRPVPSATPVCNPATPWLTTITTQEHAGDWEVAAANARSALTDALLCADARTALAEAAVANGLHALTARATNPGDAPAQQQAVDQYRSLLRFAQDQGVPLPKSPRQVAEDSYKVGAFLLAKEAWEDALDRGDISTADQRQVRFYHDTLYNLGWWQVQGPAGGQTQGVRLLVTAYQLDQRYGFRGGLAEQTLRKIAGADPAAWPQALPTPLLPSGSEG